MDCSRMREMFVKFLEEIKELKISELGGKGYSLAVLMNNGFNVPKGFVITSNAFFEHLRYNNLLDKVKNLAAEINIENFQDKSREIRNLILNGKIPENIASEIAESLKKLNVKYLSIRSSAVSEDSLKASFAGMHDTFLNVKAELNQVLENVKKCWASLFNERAIIYRVVKKLPHLEGMAVIIQEMIPAEVSGVTFTVHPTQLKNLLIEASYGVGDMIVGGRVQPDEYLLERDSMEIVEVRVGSKGKMSVIEKEGIRIVDVPKETSSKQVLSEYKIKEIALTSLKVERLFNYPQDIEWCISNNKLWLLQSRAITGVEK